MTKRHFVRIAQLLGATLATCDTPEERAVADMMIAGMGSICADANANYNRDTFASAITKAERDFRASALLALRGGR